MDLKNRFGNVETNRRDRLHICLLQIVVTSAATTSWALTCRWRSRPQHQDRKYLKRPSALLPIGSRMIAGNDCVTGSSFSSTRTICGGSQRCVNSTQADYSQATREFQLHQLFFLGERDCRDTWSILMCGFVCAKRKMMPCDLTIRLAAASVALVLVLVQELPALAQSQGEPASDANSEAPKADVRSQRCAPLSRRRLPHPGAGCC